MSVGRAEGEPQRLRYYLRREEDGSVSQLSRIVATEGELWGQYWSEGEWRDNNRVLDYLVEGDGEDITEAEAQTIIEAAR